MQIVLMALGTRGDVQPMIALGLALKAVGHRVRIVAGSNFATWIESHGLEIYPTSDIEALMQTELGIKLVETKSPFEQLKTLKTVTDSLLEPTFDAMIGGTKGADLIISGFFNEPYVQAVSKKFGIPFVSCALQPCRTTRSGPATLMPIIAQRDSFLNRWVGGVTRFFTWKAYATVVNALRHRLDLKPHTTSSYSRAVSKIPALYAMSRYVVPPTNDTNSYTTGFWFLDEPFSPPDELVRFLQSGDAPVYVGFGSMPSSDPVRTMAMISQALSRIGRRGVIARGWSKADVKNIPEHIFVLDNAPHSWLFPHMAAVVHHGGAGTTSAGLRAGVPSLVIPHMADQPYWARRLHELGVSVAPLKRHELSIELLVERLTLLLNDATIRSRAAALGEQIRAERGVDNAVEWLQTYISKLAQQQPQPVVGQLIPDTLLRSLE
jgi:sterol 3beta-glucosyltransferase